MSEISPYGTNQNAGREGPVTANQLVGQRAGSAIGDASTPGVGPATHSTAPYRGKQYQRLPRRGVKGCYAKNGNCGAPAVSGTKLCIFHTPKEQREPPAAS
jgi:hypothetical protein